MARTVVDIDDEALAAAATELGTTTKVDTVNAALREIAARKLRNAFLAQASAGAFSHLVGDREDAWR